MANVNVENLRKLEKNMREYFEELCDKMRSMEAKILRIFRDKEEAMSYLDLRINSVENSQKTVNEVLKKFTDQ